MNTHLPGLDVVAKVEALAQAERRRFALGCKRQIPVEADACRRGGEIRAVPRTEGSSRRA